MSSIKIKIRFFVLGTLIVCQTNFILLLVLKLFERTCLLNVKIDNLLIFL